MQMERSLGKGIGETASVPFNSASKRRIQGQVWRVRPSPEIPPSDDSEDVLNTG